MEIFFDNSHYSHQVRLTLKEKAQHCEERPLDPENNSEHARVVAELNLRGRLPILRDRNLLVDDPMIIMQYLEERFPYPALMPMTPGERAVMRAKIDRVMELLYTPLDKIFKLEPTTKPQREKAKKQFHENFRSILPDLAERRVSDGVDLLDHVLAPMLWRLPSLNIKLSRTRVAERKVRDYMDAMFDRQVFIDSLTEEERDIHR